MCLTGFLGLKRDPETFWNSCFHFSSSTCLDWSKMISGHIMLICFSLYSSLISLYFVRMKRSRRKNFHWKSSMVQSGSSEMLSTNSSSSNPLAGVVSWGIENPAFCSSTFIVWLLYQVSGVSKSFLTFQGEIKRLSQFHLSSSSSQSESSKSGIQNVILSCEVNF